ncbi:MAG TPA: ATP-binding protein [Candidatus Limnocylindria bacterium]|nr:ATP-binding protein [Candidatus Limnocylindria bacterium]
MKYLRRAARPVLGAAIGLAAVLLSVWLTEPATGALPLTVVLVIGIAIAGLALGADAALAAFVVGTLSLIGFVALGPDPTFSRNDVVRLVMLLIGAPAIVFLVWRGEQARRAAARALASSREAEERVEAEAQRIDAARAEADDALETAQRDRARLGEVAEAIPEPLVVYDGDLHGTYANRAALRLFGRSFVERPIEEWGRTAEPRDEHGRPLPRQEWPQIRAQAEPVRSRLLVRIPMSGRDVIVDVEGTPIPGGGAVLLWRDVGKEEDERRRLSRFASFVAHELRNPLAVAKARIELAQRDPNLPHRAATHGIRALESVDAAIGILERLELYSRADTGRVEAAREPFELAHALGSAIERLRTRGSERDVLVSLAPGVRVVGDAQLSVQAITNLLTNADRYSTPATPIHVEVEAGQQVTSLRVRDEGPGVSDEVAARLFRDRVSAGRGLGLGLYLVHATMEAMGGSVSLEQRRPCAVFVLRWPTPE